jgi:hypothetical protein
MQDYRQSIGMFNQLGKILATVHLIQATLSMIKSAIMFLPNMARSQRQMLGGYGLDFARMNADVRIAEMIDKFKIANNAGVISAGIRFTDKELISIQATRSLRTFATKAAFDFGGMIMDRFSDIGMIAQGLLTGDSRVEGLGAYGLMRGTLLFQLGRMMFPDKFTAADIAYNGYRNQLLQQARQSQVGMFVDPLVEMTGGRFSMDRAYPGNSNETNWWSSRP